MVIHDHPVFPLVDVGEAVSGRQGPGFAVSDEGKGVVAGIDRGAAVNPDQLLPKCNFQPGSPLKALTKYSRRAAGLDRTVGESVRQSTASCALRGSTLSGSFSASAAAHCSEAAATSSCGPARAIPPIRSWQTMRLARHLPKNVPIMVPPFEWRFRVNAAIRYR